jgi:hypothetical protein
MEDDDKYIPKYYSRLVPRNKKILNEMQMWHSTVGINMPNTFMEIHKKTVF